MRDVEEAPYRRADNRIYSPCASDGSGKVDACGTSLCSGSGTRRGSLRACGIVALWIGSCSGAASARSACLRGGVRCTCCPLILRSEAVRAPESNRRLVGRVAPAERTWAARPTPPGAARRAATNGTATAYARGLLDESRASVRQKMPSATNFYLFIFYDGLYLIGGPQGRPKRRGGEIAAPCFVLAFRHELCLPR
ncbi:hypothetical protein MTO96_018872 [Rhipicephalus appendiculatus]